MRSPRKRVNSSGALVAYPPSQLGLSGTPVPAITLMGAVWFEALAFDAEGNLWGADAEHSVLAMYTAAQLTVSGSPDPALTIVDSTGVLLRPNGLAFAAAGNLWVSNATSRTLGKYGAGQLAIGGALAPEVILGSFGGALVNLQGLAFDQAGSLWALTGPGGLAEYPVSVLGSSGAPPPATFRMVTGQRQAFGLAFYPRPTGIR